MTEQATLIARWKSRGGAYQLELYQNVDGSFSYAHEAGGGYIGRVTANDAFARMYQELASYAHDGHTLRLSYFRPGFVSPRVVLEIARASRHITNDH